LIDGLALVTMMFWALVPLFWIPVHGMPRLFRKLGMLTYAAPVITWLPVASLIYLNRDLLLLHKLPFPEILRTAGWFIFASGFILQAWTLKLLGGAVIMGIPEVKGTADNRVIRSGPFSVIRHPTYVSHTMMFAGVFLLSRVTALGIITLLDLLIVNVFVIPLEDRELLSRFGDQYRNYKERVPAFFPRLSGK
jgi:protein-S-isoprenylcysteine O-methyltransferase Ste14